MQTTTHPAHRTTAISTDIDLRRRVLWRSRWAAIGAAVAVTFGGGGLFVANAASSPASSIVTVSPERILDTRTDIGLPGPFVSAVSQKLQVTGAVVPAASTGVLLNVTVVAPSANGFLSIRPGDAVGSPSTSSLNFNAGDIAPNAVQVALPTSGTNAGQIDITYDAYGVGGPTTDVLIDVVGYLVEGGAGGSGLAGAPGAPGPTGQAGARGFSAWDAIPSGQTVTGSMIWDEAVIADNQDFRIYIAFPGKATPALTSDTKVNFAPDLTPETIDDDATCTGTAAAPTAPLGKVCVYRYSTTRADNITGNDNYVNGRDGFYVDAMSNGTPGQDMNVTFSWAYTAP